MPMTEDFSQFFNTAEFATIAVLDGIGNVNGIFDHAYVKTSGALGMENSNPAFQAPTAFLPDDVIGKGIRIQGVLYNVVDKEPEFEPGLTLLILEQA